MKINNSDRSSRWLPLLVIVTMCGPLLSARADETTAIGVITSLTGNAATYGMDIRDSIEFARQTLGQGRYRLLVEDDKCDPKTAVTAAQKLVSIDHVKYVLGFGCSGAVLATAPIFERSKVLLITPGTSAPAISNAGDYIFRTWPSDAIAGKLLYEALAARYRKIGIIAEETDYCEGQVKELEHLNSSENRLQLEEVLFQPGETDFRSLLTMLLAKKVDAVFLTAQSETEFLAVLKQLRDLNKSVPIYNIYNAGTENFLKTAGPLGNGVIVIDLPSLESVITPEGRKLYQQFLAEHGAPRTWDLLWATSFEAFRALHLALTSGKDPRAFLYGAVIDGVFGKYSFDSNGDISGISQVIKTVRDGKAEALR